MYLLDANIFIQSNRAHYGLDFVPAFWEWLDRAHAAGNVASIQGIGGEIAVGGDNLSTWAASRPGLFLPMDAACAPSLSALSTWANSGDFLPAAVAEFLSVADYELVAFARTHGCTVVTMEKSEPHRKNKVKIPDACMAHSVPYMTPFAMLRAESAKFVLP
jgi:hypothetical protein